jgi:hypothetical protein
MEQWVSRIVVAATRVESHRCNAPSIFSHHSWTMQRRLTAGPLRKGCLPFMYRAKSLRSLSASVIKSIAIADWTSARVLVHCDLMQRNNLDFSR